MAAALIQMAISRSREYEADRLGGQICGNPVWLADALAKIAAGVAHIPERDGGGEACYGAHVHHQSPERRAAWITSFRPTPTPATVSPRLMDQAQSMGIGRRAAAPRLTGQAGASPWGSEPRRPRAVGLSHGPTTPPSAACRARTAADHARATHPACRLAALAADADRRGAGRPRRAR